MEWISAVLGALVAVLGMQLWHWRTMAKLGARVRKLELAIEELQNPEDGEDFGDYGQQCMDLSDEWRKYGEGQGPAVVVPAVMTLPDRYQPAPNVFESAVLMNRPLPVVRHMSVPGLIALLPRKGIRIQPALDGLGLKVVASYFCMENYKSSVGESLEFDMKQVAENTGPEWELTVVHNAEMMQYEFRFLKHDGVVHP